MPMIAKVPTTTKSFVTLLWIGKCFSKLLKAMKYAMLAMMKTISNSIMLMGGNDGVTMG